MIFIETSVTFITCVLFFINCMVAITVFKKTKVEDFLDEDDTEEYIYTCKELTIKDARLTFCIVIALSILCIFIKELYILYPIIPLLSAIFIIDFRMKGIPLTLNFALIATNIILLIINRDLVGIRNGVVCAIFMYIIYILIILLTGAMGGGDALLIAGLSLLVSANQIPKILIYPFLIGSVIALALHFIKKKTKSYSFPFAPSILTAIFFVLI